MFRPFLTLLAASILMLAPVSASAATVNFFGPIVSPECNCRDLVTEEGLEYVSAPDWGCVLQTFQNAISFGVSIIIIMITLMIAYSGIMFMVNPTNAEHRSKAKSMIMNALIGLVIVLTSWLIVDFIMKALYNPDATKGYTKGEALPWNRILGDDATSDKLCFKPINLPEPPPGSDTLNVGEPGSGDAPGEPAPPDGPGTTPPPASGNGTATAVPQTPKYFSATTGNSAGEIQLAWSPENGVDSYQIDWAIETSKNSGNPGTFKKLVVLDGNETDYLHAKLATNLLVYYRLFAFNEAGVSSIPARTQAVSKASAGTTSTTPTTPPPSTGGSGSTANLSTAGTCQVRTSGRCGVSNFTMFGRVASEASQVCFGESSGKADISGDKITKGVSKGKAVSFGLFQINITVHKVNGLNCPAAFDSKYTGSNTDVVITNSALYEQCAQAAKDPAINIATAYRIYNEADKTWRDWSAAKKCKLALAPELPIIAAIDAEARDIVSICAS